MDSFLTYYGLDWLGMALSLLAVWMLGNKNPRGFLVFVVANTIWVALGIWFMNSLGIAVGNAVFLIMNARGFYKWQQQQARAIV